jgi:hypothetical protein
MDDALDSDKVFEHSKKDDITAGGKKPDLVPKLRTQSIELRIASRILDALENRPDHPGSLCRATLRDEFGDHRDIVCDKGGKA